MRRQILLCQKLSREKPNSLTAAMSTGARVRRQIRKTGKKQLEKAGFG
ncbi:hypothetical protein FIU95_20125 [Microbulbifer sp. THAF38]|nr:hypothetical protein FIU95_20125 [Microbulbifer sp. THAF38]